MWRAVTAILAVASFAFTAVAGAEDWPTRPVTMINPFAAGGPNDVLAKPTRARCNSPPQAPARLFISAAR